MSEELMVDARDVFKHYGATPVLNGFTLELKRGEIGTLMGPSGSGKSTFLRCVNHLEVVDKGYVKVDGELLGYRQSSRGVHELRDREVARQRAEIGMVFQQFNLFQHFTTLENVIEAPIGVKRERRSDAIENAVRLLQLVGLGHKHNSRPAELSGGEQQRVAIARALAMRPKLMLFDEPTSALDPELVGEVLDVMRELAQSGMTMLIVTHEVGFAREVSDWIAMVSGGRVIESGPRDQLLVSPQHERTRDFLARVH